MRKIVLLAFSFLVVLSAGCSPDRDVSEVATATQVDDIPTQTQAVTPTEKSIPTTTPIPSIRERIANHGYPKLYNQFQSGTPDDATLKDMERLSLWDFVTIDAESPEAIEYLAGPEGVLRSANPNLIITFYFSAGNSEPTNEGIFGRFNEGLQPNWLLRDVNGKLVNAVEFQNGWAGYYNLAAPGLTEYFIEFIQRELIEPGLFDGVLYDWGACSEFSWWNDRHMAENDGARIDLDQDGVGETDEEFDSLMREGLRNLHNRSREIFGDEILLHGNGGGDSTPLYVTTLNGNMIEDFQSAIEPEPQDQYRISWSSQMMVYGSYALQAQEPRIASNVVNGEQDPDNFDLMRFTLASTLLFDGYYAFVGSHPVYGYWATTWWYDEYSVDTQTGQAVESLEYKGYLGEPLGPAFNEFDPAQQLIDALGIGAGPVDFSNKVAETKVWRRDFEHGIVLVNPTNKSMTVDLGDTFRKIQGTRDPVFNDGSEVNSIVLPPTSGVILLRW